MALAPVADAIWHRTKPGWHGLKSARLSFSFRFGLHRCSLAALGQRKISIVAMRMVNLDDPASVETFPIALAGPLRHARVVWIFLRCAFENRSVIRLNIHLRWPSFDSWIQSQARLAAGWLPRAKVCPVVPAANRPASLAIHRWRASGRFDRALVAYHPYRPYIDTKIAPCHYKFPYGVYEGVLK